MGTRTYSLSAQSDELKRLIAKYPDYDIAVLAGEEANGGDYSWMYCSDIRFEVGELLDTDYCGYNDNVFTDRDELEEFIEDSLYDEGLEGDELDKAAKAKLAELEPYWKNVIFIWATN